MKGEEKKERETKGQRENTFESEGVSKRKRENVEVGNSIDVHYRDRRDIS